MHASQKLFERAQRVTPGGVNSPVRAFGSVGGTPVFLARAQGAHIFDVDDRQYLDFVGSWGPLILGHAAPAVIEAVTRTARLGTTFGATTEREVELAELVTKLVPSVKKVRFTSSGTEATMSALRLARGFTKRDKVLKFSGCYHGHADAFLTEAGSGVATLGIPGTAGVPQATAADTLTVPYNDLAAVEKLLQQVGSQVAAIIVEPVACNMGLVLPEADFLAGLRRVCDTHGILLIFDEVITGFRVALGGAQAHFGSTPDLTTFGKIIGGGLPVGAFGGRADIMDHLSPKGPVYQAGTLSGNPLAMAAGIAMLKALQQPGFYERLEGLGAHLEKGLRKVLTKHGQPAHFDRLGSIFYLWFKAKQSARPRNYADIKTGQADVYAKFFHALLAKGMYLAPSAYEVGFLSAAHTQDHIDQAIAWMDACLPQIA